MNNHSDLDLKAFIPLLKPHIKKLVLGFCFMFIYVACWPILAWLAGELIPAIGQGSLNKVIKVILFALIIFLIQKLAQFFQDTILAAPALRISQHIRIRIFSKIQNIKLEALTKLSTGDITYRLTEDADRIGEVIYKTIQDTTPCILQLIAVFGYMIIIDWQLSIATLFLAPLVAILVGRFGAKVMVAAENSQKQVSDLAGLLTEGIQGLPLIRAFGAEEWIQSRFNKEVNLHREAKYKTLRLLALQHPIIGFIEALGILAVLVIGAARIQSGGLNAQGFSSYVAALLMLIDPISHLTTNFNELKQGEASMKRLNEIANKPIEENQKNNTIMLDSAKGNIKIEDVCFAYDTGNIVIENINIDIDSGQIIALVGPSGAGKTTLFSLILRFNRPTQGAIYLDDVKLSKIKSKQLRNEIALVPQNSTTFSGTIEESIRLGRDFNHQKIINAAKMANAHDFIISMKDGYNTKLEERGINFSGGQLQRIAIARALLGNPSILLLDEATSALDAESEQEVQKGLQQAMKDRTVIVIAHRLSTVQGADKIIVMDKGKVIESGTHSYLMKKGGRYRELCEKQIINS